jgi:hypothetical protein
MPIGRRLDVTNDVQSRVPEEYVIRMETLCTQVERVLFEGMNDETEDCLVRAFGELEAYRMTNPTLFRCDKWAEPV